MAGDYRQLCNIPNLDTYVYYSKGHEVTKCKYLVLQHMLELVQTSDTSLFVTNVPRISDSDLFEKGLQTLQSNFIGADGKPNTRNTEYNGYRLSHTCY